MPEIIKTAHLFPVLDEKLISLLRTLSPADWEKKTVAKLWTVRDVAAHLLDGNLRVISLYRDGFSSPPDREIDSYTTLVAYLNQLNADFVKAAKRLSPALLTDLLESIGKQYSEIMAKQDLHSDAPFSVAWAGEAVSKNWFHIAREYTEKWHHQQQIREAVGKQGIMGDALYFPFIATLLRGLPHTYKNVEAAQGTTISITVKSEKSHSWILRKSNADWDLGNVVGLGKCNASMEIPADIAWKLFTKAISPAEARSMISISGDIALAENALNLIAVMA